MFLRLDCALRVSLPRVFIIGLLIEGLTFSYFFAWTCLTSSTYIIKYEQSKQLGRSRIGATDLGSKIRSLKLLPKASHFIKSCCLERLTFGARVGMGDLFELPQTRFGSLNPSCFYDWIAWVSLPRVFTIGLQSEGLISSCFYDWIAH